MTVALDDDNMARLRLLQQQHNLRWKEVVNQVLRVGIALAEEEEKAQKRKRRRTRQSQPRREPEP